METVFYASWQVEATPLQSDAVAAKEEPLSLTSEISSELN